ncbi:hypothetical protein [Micromonospora deserti]|uniref:Uncharacterized protein n=1 Tax=Micromonospora deserti TaxID=2070366 RepID=A0A2W2CK10_9ACTN|nr:hypothetical protein [Micromonospora deserti]PZF98260.1 hypothetical protein C1I99_13825 [Micromonospora deserti]
MDWARVKDSTGHEVTMRRDRAEGLGLETVDKPATDQLGRPLPAKVSTDKAARPPRSRETTR